MSPEPPPGVYEVLSHTADTGIRATADSLASLIAVLARGMFALMALCDPTASTIDVTFEVEAPTIEDLVVDTLSELLFRAESDDLVFCEFRVEADSENLRASVLATGVPVASTEPTGPPVKAVTYHDLIVEHDSSGKWRARVYFDV